MTTYAAGFVTSFVVGLFALLLLMRLAAKEQFDVFCVVLLAIRHFLTLFYFNVI